MLQMDPPLVSAKQDKDIKILKCFRFDVCKTCIYTSDLLSLWELTKKHQYSLFLEIYIANDKDIMLLNLCGHGWRPRFSVLRFLLPFWVLYHVLERQKSSILKFPRSFHLWSWSYVLYRILDNFSTSLIIIERLRRHLVVSTPRFLQS